MMPDDFDRAYAESDGPAAVADYVGRRPLLLADVEARQRGENLDGSPRRETLSVREAVEPGLREALATQQTCAHMTNHVGCVWHTRSWSPDCKPERCAGCPDRVSSAPLSETLCEDCPPVGYTTDKTRCTPCPRRAALTAAPARQRDGSPRREMGEVEARTLQWQMMPSYGLIRWDQLTEAVAQAGIGDRKAPLQRQHPSVYIGHDHPGINYNSLNRIVSAFVLAALKDAAPASGETRVTEDLVAAAIELAQYASYCESVGHLANNRPHLRKWCDEVFRLNREREKAQDEAALASIQPPPGDGRGSGGGLPEDVLELARKMGKVEWGTVKPKTDEEHVVDFRDTLRITREHFGIATEMLDLHGLYLEGTETVFCHTGVSPTSGPRARVLVGLWNNLVDRARQPTAAKPQSEGERC